MLDSFRASFQDDLLKAFDEESSDRFIETTESFLKLLFRDMKLHKSVQAAQVKVEKMIYDFKNWRRICQHLSEVEVFDDESLAKFRAEAKEFGLVMEIVDKFLQETVAKAAEEVLRRYY